MQCSLYTLINLEVNVHVKMGMQPTFTFTCSWKKKKFHFLGNSPQVTFPVFYPHIPLQS